jgi:hypothetical protein
LHAGHYSRDLSSAVAAIADHLNLAIASREIEEIIAEVAAANISATTPAAGDWSAGMAEEEAAVVVGALGPYAKRFSGNPLDEIVWSRDLFYQEGHRPAERVVDITGPSRYLIYGPFVTLPPGAWSAEILVGFSQEASEINFVVDVFAGAQLNSARLSPTGSGVVQVNIGFQIAESNDNLIEIRIMNERAVFDGKLAMVRVGLRPRGEILGTTLEQLTTELGLPTRPAG